MGTECYESSKTRSGKTYQHVSQQNLSAADVFDIDVGHMNTRELYALREQLINMLLYANHNFRMSRHSTRRRELYALREKIINMLVHINRQFRMSRHSARR